MVKLQRQLDQKMNTFKSVTDFFYVTGRESLTDKKCTFKQIGTQQEFQTISFNFR